MITYEDFEDVVIIIMLLHILFYVIVEGSWALPGIRRGKNVDEINKCRESERLVKLLHFLL